MEDVPEQQEEASAWLHKLWLEKDKIKEKALEEDWEGLEEMGIKPFEGKGVGRVMALQRLPSIQTQLISHDQALSCTDLDFILWGDRKCSCYLPPFLSHNTGKSDHTGKSDNMGKFHNRGKPHNTGKPQNTGKIIYNSDCSHSPNSVLNLNMNIIM